MICEFVRAVSGIENADCVPKHGSTEYRNYGLFRLPYSGIIELKNGAEKNIRNTGWWLRIKAFTGKC
jgi:hypothetical protein